MPTLPIITDAEIAEIRRMAAERPGEPGGDHDLSGIRTVAELIGYLATVAREKGWDEVEESRPSSRSRRPVASMCAKPSSCCGSLATPRYATTCGKLQGISRRSHRADGCAVDRNR